MRDADLKIEYWKAIADKAGVTVKIIENGAKGFTVYPADKVGQHGYGIPINAAISVEEFRAIISRLRGGRT